MERELLMTGIGGQGVQLAGQLLARAAVAAGRHVQLFGSYGGMMRGGNTDITLIAADRPVESPPTVSEAWSAIVMHHAYCRPVLARLRAGGLVLVNTGVVSQPVEHPAQHTVLIDATGVATELGIPAAAAMVALGAYAAATGMVPLDRLVDALPEVLPPYRKRHIAGNERALRAGAALVPAVVAPAWPADATTADATTTADAAGTAEPAVAELAAAAARTEASG